MSIVTATVSVSTLWGTGNRILETANQGSTYEGWGWTTPLLWDGALAQPTPTGAAVIAPTVGMEFPHNLFTGEASGYWVYHLFLGGHHQYTFTAMDQAFAMAVPFDRVESVSLGVSPLAAAVPVGSDCDVPAPAGAAVVLCAALLTRFRQRKA